MSMLYNNITFFTIIFSYKRKMQALLDEDDEHRPVKMARYDSDDAVEMSWDMLFILFPAPIDTVTMYIGPGKLWII